MEQVHELQNLHKIFTKLDSNSQSWVWFTTFQLVDSVFSDLDHLEETE